MTSRRGTDRLIEPHLEPGETPEVVLRGVIPGFTLWSIGAFAVVLGAGLVIPAAFDLNLGLSLIVLVIIVFGGLGGFLALVGKPLARRYDPPLGGPYVTLLLSDRRLVLLASGEGKELTMVAESVPRGEVRVVSWKEGNFLGVPHRLELETPNGSRKFEFPSREKLGDLVEALPD